MINDYAVEWSKAYGVADVGTGTPVDTATRFQAGEATQSVTALAAKGDAGHVYREERIAACEVRDPVGQKNHRHHENRIETVVLQLDPIERNGRQPAGSIIS